MYEPRRVSNAKDDPSSGGRGPLGTKVIPTHSRASASLVEPLMLLVI
jgi:hypothetical protein